MEMPSFHNYMGNGRDNALTFIMNGIQVYFSYKIPIAFRAGSRLVVRENDWSNTTGRHLNTIDGGDKSSRVSGKEFEKLLEWALR